MKILGLTGPSGAGKTLFSFFLCAKGCPCINADELYHSMLIPPSHLLDAIRREFGDSFFNENGELDRKALGKLVFSSKESLDKLNATVLPAVIEKMQDIAASYEKNGARLLIIDAPTLFEAGYDKSCDLTVSILAPSSIRIERISERDDISIDDAILRTNAQKDDSFYRERSDRIILNDSDENALKEKALALLNEILDEDAL
jgi:dephospho-CoA kinase